jgi:hypothetical protein
VEKVVNSEEKKKRVNVDKENKEDVNLRKEESIVMRVGSDGGIKKFEMNGIVKMRIYDEKLGRIRVKMENKDKRGIKLKKNKKVEKELFKEK